MGAFKVVKLVDPIFIATNGVAMAHTGSTATSGTFKLYEGNNITFTTAGNSVTIHGGAGVGGGGIGIAAGTRTATTAGTLLFDNANGVTFGLNAVGGSVMTASHNAITTARASNDAIGLNSALTANGVSMTANSSGLSLNFPAFLTTAQPVGAYLTTARASNDAIGLNTALTANGLSVTANSSGLSINVPAWLTTAALSGDTTKYAGVGETIGTTAGTDLAMTVNTDGVNISHPKWITTGMLSNAATISNIRVSGGTTSNLLSALTFADSNGVSFGLNAGTMTATVKTDYLTTAMASNRGSDFVQANAAFAGTNASGTIASNGISVSVNPAAAGVGIEAGTRTATTAGNLRFETGNGITFGLNGVGGSVMTASHNAITTGRASNDAIGLATAKTNVTWTVNSAGLSFDASGYAGTTTAVTGGIAITANSDGIRASVGAYLTTGALSGDTTKYVQAWELTGNTAGTTSSLQGTKMYFEGGQGISVSGNSNTIKLSVGSYITTGRASTDAVGLATALTAGPLAWTVNSAGISLNAGSAAGTTSGFTGGASISGSMTHNTAGLAVSLSHPAWITTAMQSNAATISNIRVSGGTTSNLLSAITFADSNGISFGLNAGTMTATVKTDYLTTAAQSNHSHGNPTLALTNLTGTTASASNGFTLSLSAAAPGGGADVVASASNGAFTFTTLGFSNANNVTFGTSAGSIITASVAAPGAAAENNWVHALGANTAGNTTASGSTIGYSGINLTLSGTNGSVMNISAPATSSLSATGQVSLSTNGSTISIGVPNINTLSSYWEGIDKMTLLHAGANGNISVERLQVDQYVSASMIGIPLYQSLASSGAANTYGQQWSIYAMVLTNDTANNRLMSLSSGSTQTTYTVASNTVGATQLNGSAVRPLTVPININMTPGVYYMAFNLSTNTYSSGTATTALGRTASFLGRGVLMSASFGMVSAYDVAIGNTNNRLWPQGVVSGGASAGIPLTISHSQMTMTGLSHSQANLAFYLRA